MKKIAILLVDLIVIFGSIILSFILLKNGVLLDYTTNIGAFYYVSPTIFIMYMILAYVFGMYNLRRQSVADIIYTVLIVSVALTICIMAACFFIRESAFSYPRSVIMLSAMVYFIGLILWRTLLRSMYYRNFGNRSVMIIGSDHEGIISRIQSKFANLYQVKYVCAEDDASIMDKANEVSDIFITHDVSSNIREQIFLLPLEHKNIAVYFVPKMNDIGIMNARLAKFDDIPTHMFSRMFLTDEERGVKRMMDIFFSIILLILASPLFIILPLIIMADGGSIFYRQERYTRNKKRFKIIKFRTMVPNAEKLSGPVLADKKDPRITKIGHFLRATRLDELPQLFNILQGDMSVVGPRPERPFFSDKLELEIPEFKYRMNVKAGLTGLAQVMGKYNTDFRQKLQYDLYYINNFSIFRDILIILQTIRILFQKDKSEGFK